MSKTVRRKNAPASEIRRNVDDWIYPRYPWYTVRCLPISGYSQVTQEKILADAKYLRHRLKQRYHSDKFFAMNAPKMFRQSLERQLRRKNNEILSKALRNNHEDEAVFIPFKHNANWHWW